MYSNDMDANPYQQKIQSQLKANHLGQTLETAETQQNAHAQRINELNTTQKTNELFRTSEALMLTAMNSGEKVKEMADPNVATARLNSLFEQSRLKGMMS